MFRRSISSTLSIIRRPRPTPISSNVSRTNDIDENRVDSKNCPLRQFYSGNYTDSTYGFHVNVKVFSGPFGLEFPFRMYSSSVVEGESDRADYMNDMAEILTDKTMDVAIAHTPPVNEVVLAASDSFFPIAALQHFIDGIHSFTGFNWWASIVLTTFLMRTATVPLLINQVKATSKLSQIRPEMEAIRLRMQDCVDPKSMRQGQEEIKALFVRHGVTPFTPLRGILIQGPLFISFYLAIINMVEKVPSFKEGGAYWFVDLTTPDSLYIFPILTSLTFLATVELNMQEGLEGNPVAGTMKNFSRIFAVLTIPFTMSFPKAIFCYWVTSNLFSLVYGLVLKRPAVKKYIGLPDVVPSSNDSQVPNFSLFGVSKPAVPSAYHLSEQSKIPERRISSASVLSQRIRTLEKAVKGRKKAK